MNKLISSILVVIIFLSSTSKTLAEDLCVTTGTGYTVAFFNGVWNTEQDAFDSMLALSEAVGTSFNGEQVNFTLMYNETGDVNGASMFQDVAEVFIQRGKELGLDPTKHFHLFYDATTKNSTGFFASLTKVLGAAGSAVLSIADELYSFVSGKTAEILSNLVSNPPTDKDYASQTATLNRIAVEGEKIMLLAHSQGNLFMNQAYIRVLSFEGITDQNVKALHVAPASIKLSGQHVLADIDIVINGLRAFGLNSIAPITVDLPVSHLLIDPSGHTFAGTYLESTLPAFDQIKSLYESAMSSLIAPPIKVSQGSFTGTLLWSSPGDVDLHVFEPSGRHVYYGSKRGNVGYLDLDDRSKTGPEHYYASCDSNEVELGDYIFAVNNYGAPAGVTAALQVSKPGVDDMLTKAITLGVPKGKAGDNAPSALIRVNVSKDVSGKFIIKAL